MQELLEQAVNNPHVQYILENPDVAVAGALAGSVPVAAAVSTAGQVQGEREIERLEQKFDSEQAYEQAVLERKEELAEEIERESAAREIYMHIVHGYTSGKLGAFEEEETRIESPRSEREEDLEFYNQKFTDEELEYLD